jgi:hypothetical protein
LLHHASHLIDEVRQTIMEDIRKHDDLLTAVSKGKLRKKKKKKRNFIYIFIEYKKSNYKNGATSILVQLGAKTVQWNLNISLDLLIIVPNFSL